MTINIAQGSAEALPATDTSSTLLVGNPNVGKSVLFGILTGRYAHVANYPGTTVEVTRGRNKRSGGEVVDTPGANSLMPSSEDERVTRDIVLEQIKAGDPRVLQVCDSRNLRRGITLALEFAELAVPTVLVANMSDEARTRGITVDHAALSEVLGVDVLPTVATRRQGTGAIASGNLGFRRGAGHVTYKQPIEEAIAEVMPLLPDGILGRRGLALLLLTSDKSMNEWAGRLLGSRVGELTAIRKRLQERNREPVRVSIHRARLAEADKIVAQTVTRTTVVRREWLRKLGDWAMHPVGGLFVAAAALWVIYQFVGVFGAGTAVDFLESTVFEQYVTPWADTFFRAILPAGLETFMVGAPGTELGTGPGLLVGDYGMVSMALSYSVAIVLPIVGFFFIAFSIMEDSGYLPRLAVVLDRVFRLIGLNGKAVLPMVLGLGCDTMATMTARILPSKKERVLVTLLLALAIPCSAQLGVILGMLAGLSTWGTLAWIGSVFGVLVLVGFIASKVLPGRSADFVLEIPPMRRPALGSVLIKTAARIEWYLKEAVPLFILGTFVLWVADRLQILGGIQKAAAPVVEGFLGLPTAATDAFLIGFLRRDYGAAGLYDIYNDQLSAGPLPVETEIQVVVAMITITLFVPCIANVFIIAKERGVKAALAMTAFIFPFAFVVGGVVNFVLRGLLL